MYSQPAVTRSCNEHLSRAGFVSTTQHEQTQRLTDALQRSEITAEKCKALSRTLFLILLQKHCVCKISSFTHAGPVGWHYLELAPAWNLSVARVAVIYVCLNQNLQTDSRKRAVFPTAPCKSFLHWGGSTHLVYVLNQPGLNLQDQSSSISATHQAWSMCPMKQMTWQSPDQAVFYSVYLTSDLVLRPTLCLPANCHSHYESYGFLRGFFLSKSSTALPWHTVTGSAIKWNQNPKRQQLLIALISIPISDLPYSWQNR